jgi:hypothetical protein
VWRCLVQSQIGRPAGLGGDCEGPVHDIYGNSESAAVRVRIALQQSRAAAVPVGIALR